MSAPAASGRDGLFAPRGPNRPIIPHLRLSQKGKAYALFGLAVLAATPGLLVPLFNPDLFWHLSAGDWIVAHRALPRADFLSFSRAGSPWLDFEWLSQVVFSLVYALAGMAGLWLLKITFLGLGWFLVDRALVENRVPAAGRALGLALFGAGVFGSSDIRPDLFSLLFFGLLLWQLEAWRLGRLRRPRLKLGLLFPLFALWADFHAGFFFGFALIGCYVAAEALRGRRDRASFAFAGLVVAAAGSTANPYGLGPHIVALSHWRMGAQLSRVIAEWHPMTTKNPVYWPFWPAWAAAALLLALRAAAPPRKREALPAGAALAAALFGAAALAHLRLSLFFAAPAALLIVLLARERGWLSPRPCAAALASYAAFSLWLVPRVTWRSWFNEKYVPARAASFIADNRGVFAPLRLYNQWEWGGYLAWRLPWLKVFVDGRYLFHDVLLQIAAASQSDASWNQFSRREGFTAELLPNLNQEFQTTRRYPDGSTKPFARPWYLFYMPRPRWALVYWDDQALLFVDREDVPREWLAAHEYRWARPKDGAAFADALRLGEIPKPAFEAELARHAGETAGR